MTDAAQLPQTSAAADKLIIEMKARRGPLLEAIEGADAGKRASAALAEMGNSSAQARLQSAEADAKQARAALQRLDDVIRSLEQHRETVYRAERDARAQAEAERLKQAVDELLELDDRIDSAAEALREMLQQRRQMLDGGLQLAGRFGLGIGAARAAGLALLSYFDRELWFVREPQRYEDLHSIAKHDGEAFGRSSLGSLERGPREPTITEKALLRAIG